MSLWSLLWGFWCKHLSQGPAWGCSRGLRGERRSDERTKFCHHLHYPTPAPHPGPGEAQAKSTNSPHDCWWCSWESREALKPNWSCALTTKKGSSSWWECVLFHIWGTSAKNLVSNLLKEKELLHTKRLLWFEDHISHTDSAPPGSHLSLTILTLNTTFPFLSSLPQLTSLLPPSPPRSFFFPLISWLFQGVPSSSVNMTEELRQWGSDSHQLLRAPRPPVTALPLTPPRFTHFPGKKKKRLQLEKVTPVCRTDSRVRRKPSMSAWWRRTFSPEDV